MSPRTRSPRTQTSRGRCPRTAARVRAETSTLPRKQRSRSILCPGTTCSSATSPRTTCWECTSPSPSSNGSSKHQPAGRELGGLSFGRRWLRRHLSSGSGCPWFGLRHVVAGEESLDDVGLSVGVHDADVRVPAGASVELRKDPEKMREHDPIHTAVADDEDRLAWALARQPIDRAKRARQDLIERLATRPGEEAVVAPVRETASLVERRPGAVADVDLSKLGQGLDRNSVPLRDHLRGVSGSREIARHDPVELHLGELIGDRGGLLPPARRQRRVRLSRKHARGVALALTVAHEIEGRWLHDSARCCVRSVQPATRVLRSPFTSRFQGWSNRNTRTPDCASLCEMTTSSSQNASSSSSFARRTLYSAEPAGS